MGQLPAPSPAEFEREDLEGVADAVGEAAEGRRGARGGHEGGGSSGLGDDLVSPDRRDHAGGGSGPRHDRGLVGHYAVAGRCRGGSRGDGKTRSSRRRCPQRGARGGLDGELTEHAHLEHGAGLAAGLAGPQRRPPAGVHHEVPVALHVGVGAGRARPRRPHHRAVIGVVDEVATREHGQLELLAQGQAHRQERLSHLDRTGDEGARTPAEQHPGAPQGDAGGRVDGQLTLDVQGQEGPGVAPGVAGPHRLVGLRVHHEVPVALHHRVGTHRTRLVGTRRPHRHA